MLCSQFHPISLKVKVSYLWKVREKAFKLWLISDISLNVMMLAMENWDSIASGFLPRHPVIWELPSLAKRGFCSLWRTPFSLESRLSGIVRCFLAYWLAMASLWRVSDFTIMCSLELLVVGSLWARFLLLVARPGLVKMWTL